MLTHLDLCSGIGGFALAANANGYTTIGFCEIDPYCQRVLRKHWPETPIHADLRTLTGDIVRGWSDSALANTDCTDGKARGADRIRDDARKGGQPPRHRGETVGLLTAGYPCQPFSQAGKRLGEADDRHLWPAIAALVAELKPAQCLFENVAGHISMGLDGVLADLEALGYACGTVVVPACAVNAPHRRDRVWIMAHADHKRGDGTGTPWDGRDEPQDLGESVSDTAPVFGRSIERIESDGTVRVAATASDPYHPRRTQQRFTVAGGTKHAALERGGWWSAEPNVGRVAHGVPARVDRLRSLGNAIVPQVAAEIIGAMREAA